MGMKQKTILLWGRGDLLSSSVELFLTNQKEWHVFNLPNDENTESLIKKVDELSPDVVIIHQWDRAGALNLPTNLLQGHPGLKVITVNPENDVLEVYSKQDIMVKSASDLISVIKADMKSVSGKKEDETSNSNIKEVVNPKKTQILSVTE